MIDDIASFALSGPDAIKTNSIINTKIESKKLEFGPTKCYNIHIGELKDTHLNLKVHGEILNVKQYETYLGDVICGSGFNDKNIEKRRNQGLATINQIISMLNMTSLGHYYFEIALILRESILVSKLLFNSEVWYNLSNKQIEKLEQIDEIYLRRILNCSKTTPKVGIYLECGVIPLNFVVKMRRLLYYWHLLHREKDELIFKFYTVQNYSPSEGDWVQLVKKDISDIRLGLSEAEIKTMSKYQFKKIVKEKIVKLAASNLESRKKQKSMKLENMKFEPQEFLLSKNLSISEVQTLFKIRNNMIEVKENFKSSPGWRTIFHLVGT